MSEVMKEILRERPSLYRWTVANELISAIDQTRTLARGGVLDVLSVHRLHDVEREWDRLNGKFKPPTVEPEPAVPPERGGTLTLDELIEKHEKHGGGSE